MERTRKREEEDLSIKCWMENQYTLCFFDGNLFVNIDIRKQNNKPEWCMMEEVSKLVYTACGSRIIPSVFF